MRYVVLFVVLAGLAVGGLYYFKTQGKGTGNESSSPPPPPPAQLPPSNGNQALTGMTPGVALPPIVWPPVEDDRLPGSRTWSKDGSLMLLVNGGTFWRGSEAKRNAGAELPRQRLYVSGFYMDEHPVTNAMFQRFIDAKGYEQDGAYFKVYPHGYQAWLSHGWRAPQGWNADNAMMAPDQPVVGVSFYEAAAYAAWAGKRLPTEAEWEKAARGVEGLRFPFGDEWNPEACNWRDEDPRGGEALGSVDGFARTAPVDAFRGSRSPFGLTQMAGNVWEWCEDWYSARFFARLPKTTEARRNPLNREKLGSEPWRVLKGGSYRSAPSRCESSFRMANAPETRSDEIGFRCVVSVAKVHPQPPAGR